jgi:hypothetical protein
VSPAGFLIGACRNAGVNAREFAIQPDWMLARLKEYGDLREILRMFFEVYVVATESRRKMLATAAPHFSGISFLTAVHQKNSNETATKGELNEMKSRIGTRDDSIAAPCDQSPAGRPEGTASM